MARRERFNIVGIAQHVIQRGHNGDNCFFCYEDYQFYLQCLDQATRNYRCAIHAYCLMNNHIHLLLTPYSENSVSRCMQAIGRHFVCYINKKNARSGSLWDGRYKACLVQRGEYLVQCTRYIEENPIRLSVIDNIVDYPWSSYHSNALEEHGSFSNRGSHNHLQVENTMNPQVYRSIFSNKQTLQQIQEIREAVNKELVFGDEDFKNNIESNYHKRSRAGKSGRPIQKDHNIAACTRTLNIY